MNSHTQTSGTDNGGKDIKIPDKYQQLINKAQYKITDEIEQKPHVFSLVDEYGKETPVCSVGDFSVLIGPPKAGKSHFLALVIGSFLRKEKTDYLNTNLPPGKNKIIHFDTEQGKYHSQQILKKTLEVANLPISEQPSNLLNFNLRPFSHEERKEIVDWVLRLNQDTGFVIIDGIKDLLLSINNEEEAVKVTQKLMTWSEAYGLHILVVLHKNKIDNNARGHIGTEVVNKAETVITLEKDNNGIRTFKSDFGRNKEFGKIAIMLDDNEIPYLDDYTGEQSERKSTYDPSTMDVELCKEIALQAFNPGMFYKYSQAWNNVKNSAIRSLNLENFGDVKSKNLLKRLQNLDIVFKDENKSTYSLNIQRKLSVQ